MSLPIFKYNARMISILLRAESFRQILPARRTILKYYSFFSSFYIASSKHEGDWDVVFYLLMLSSLQDRLAGQMICSLFLNKQTDRQQTDK